MMRSPFPGMDPYTEARHLWHGIHTQLIGELSTHQLPPLLAPAYFVDVEPSLQVRSERTVYPDIQVMAARRQPEVEPAGLGLPVRELVSSGIHLMEVDLLHWGQRVVPALPDEPYHILISRADQRPQSRVWSFSLPHPIPDTPLPLIAPEEQVPLPLQAAYATIYEARNFRHRLDYRSDPDPPLTEVQQGYIQSRLIQAGLRSENGT